MAKNFEQERIGTGLLLGRLRAVKGIKLSVLAEMVGMENTNLSSILNGKRAASFEQLELIALILGWELDIQLALTIKPHDASQDKQTVDLEPWKSLRKGK